MTDDHSRAPRERDPVCGMAVRPDVAAEEGLTGDHEAHRYDFCREGCKESFLAAPAQYVTSHAAAEAAPGEAPAIDDGMRRWYESCSCCLSDAFPEVKAALDGERAANSAPEVGSGICEVAEARASSN